MSASVRGGAPKRDGQIRVRSSGGTAIIEETLNYIVVADSTTEPYLNIINASGAPLLGSTSPTGFGQLKQKSASRIDGRADHWVLSCEYSSEVEENQNNDPTQSDPIAWLPIYETKMERMQEASLKDKSGTTIANSAGQPFETGIMLTRYIPIWEFWQFESATISDETVIDRNESINSVPFKGRAAKTLLCTIITSQIGYYYGRRLRFTRYSLRYNSKKWTHKRADVGTAYKSGADLLAYTDKNGNVILGALDGSGAKQAVGTPPAIREFDMYDEKRFQDWMRI